MCLIIIYFIIIYTKSIISHFYLNSNNALVFNFYVTFNRKFNLVGTLRKIKIQMYETFQNNHENGNC